MNIAEIIAEIDAELVRLKQVKALLSDTGAEQDRKTGPLVTASLSDGSQPRRTVSRAARRKMAAAQKARWAKSRKTVKEAALKAATPTAKAVTIASPAKPAKKHSMSGAVRARIAAAQRARWAKVRKAAKKRLRQRLPAIRPPRKRLSQRLGRRHRRRRLRLPRFLLLRR